MSNRNNEDRLGVTNPGSTPPLDAMAPAESASSPVFNFVAPTEIVDLPSEGKLYPKNSYLHGIDNIEIKYMTAKEEDILTSKSLLKKGKAIDRFLRSVVINKNINIDDLLSGDRAALLVAARISGYGSEYTTNVVCPVCAERSEWSFDLNDAKVIGPENIHPDARLTETGTIIVHLPKLNVDVECRFLNGHDEKRIAKSTEMKKKNRLQETPLTDQLSAIVVSVNGQTDRALLQQLVHNMPAADSRYLRSVYQESSPNVDLTQEFSCVHCGSEGPLEVPFTTSFLWPKR